MSASFKHLEVYGLPPFVSADVPDLTDLKLVIKQFDIVPTASDPRAKERPVTAAQQNGMLKEMLAQPVGSYIACISGTQTDRTPKYMASYIFASAKRLGHNVRWVTLRSYSISGMDSLLASLNRETDQLVVLSNLIPESTAYRLEAARDIIEHSNSGKKSFIVVTAGMDPYTFMVDKMRIKPQYTINLSSSK